MFFRKSTLLPPKELKKIKKSKGDNPWVSLRDVVDYIKSKGIRIEALRLSENEISTASKKQLHPPAVFPVSRPSHNQDVLLVFLIFQPN